MNKRLLGIIVVVVAIILIVTFASGIFQKTNRSTALRLFKEGVYHYNIQEFTAASTSFIKVLSTDPTFFKARYWLGKTYYQSGYFKEALQEWQRALDLVGDDPHLKNKIARLLYNKTTPPQSKLNIDTSYLPTKGITPSDIGSPVSIFVDPINQYSWVVGYSSNNVIILDRNGIVQDTITAGDVPFNHPYDIIMTSKQEFYISDFGNDRIHKYNKDQEYLFSFGTRGLNNGEFYGPQGLTVDQYDNLYVVDSGNHRIQKYDDQGNFLFAFGKKGQGQNELLGPSDLVVIQDLIYVVDTNNHRIQIYDLNGNWKKNIASHYLKQPKGIKVINSNELLVVDQVLGIIKIDLGTLNISTMLPVDKKNNMIKPSDIAYDKNLSLYITDLGKREISIYVPDKIKFNNLDVTINQTNSSQHPTITNRVLVKDQAGNPIYGLQAGNFSVTENGMRKDAKVYLENHIKQGLSIVVLNEKSHDMSPHLNELEKVSKSLFNKLAMNDRVKVINFNNQESVIANQIQPFTNSKLLPLNAILNIGEFQEGKVIGEAFYRGVTDAFSNQTYIGAIVILTSGKMTMDSFNPYGYNVCLDYAKNNFIPVYVLSFSDGDITDELNDLTMKTGGKYYNVYTSNELNKIVDNMRKVRQPLYYIQYTTDSEPDRGHNLNDVRIEVKLKEMFGYDQSGYLAH